MYTNQDGTIVYFSPDDRDQFGQYTIDGGRTFCFAVNPSDRHMTIQHSAFMEVSPDSSLYYWESDVPMGEPVGRFGAMSRMIVDVQLNERTRWVNVQNKVNSLNSFVAEFHNSLD